MSYDAHTKNQSFETDPKSNPCVCVSREQVQNDTVDASK